MPLPPSGPVDTGGCNVKTELLLEGTQAEPRIARLALGASPTEVRLRVTHGAERIYDAVLSPAYADFPTTREESFWRIRRPTVRAVGPGYAIAPHGANIAR